MSDYDRCKICGEWGWFDRGVLKSSMFRSHVCPPSWYVWDPTYEDGIDEAKRIYARDAESAAERYAEERSWDGDCGLVERCEVFVVQCIEAGDTIPKMITVTGEMEPVFHAEEGWEDAPEDLLNKKEVVDVRAVRE